MKIFKKILLTLVILVSINTFSQEFDANLQIRTRYEFRNGYRTPIPYGETPAQFI